MRRHDEQRFQNQVLRLAKLCGWWTYHTYDARRSQPGFPDLVLVKDRILFRELKTDTGRITPEQKHVIELLTTAGADAAVWRPKDWQEIESTLTR